MAAAHRSRTAAHSRPVRATPAVGRGAVAGQGDPGRLLDLYGALRSSVVAPHAGTKERGARPAIGSVTPAPPEVEQSTIASLTQPAAGARRSCPRRLDSGNRIAASRSTSGPRQ